MAYAKEYYEMHKEDIRGYQRQYRANSKGWRESNERWKQSHPEQMKAYMVKYNYSVKGKYTKLNLRAKAAGISVDIKQGEFIEWYGQQKLLCHYCNAALNTGQGQKKMDGYSIDRMDNSKGYELDNITLCCNRCNMAKGSWFTEKQMLEIAHKYFNI